MSAEPQYERVARVERDHWWFVALREAVADELSRRRPPPARVLDAGCGTGHVIGSLPARYERVGLDSNADVLAIARLRHPDVEFVEGSIEQIPFADGSFDAVISLDVVSDARVGSPERALAEVRRVLAPGGVAIFNLPAYEWLRSGHDAIAQTGRRYTASGAARMLRDSGFGVVRTGYRVTALFPIAAIRRLMGRGRAGTDVDTVSPTLNKVLRAISHVDTMLAVRFRLPFGLSVWAVGTAVAKRPGRLRQLQTWLLAQRRLVGLVQFAVTGERVPRRHELLAGELASGNDAFVLDLGCGAAPMLEFVQPPRYVGLDEHGPSLDVARRRFARPGWQFVQTSVDGTSLAPWSEADVVVASSMTHHLSDEQVGRLLDRVFRDVAPNRLLVQDAEATGVLGPLVAALDEGAHLRSPAELSDLIQSHGYLVRFLWSYRNPLRSFHQFLLEVRSDG